MNWERIEGDWLQFKGHVKKHWGKLTDDQVDVINGQRDILAGKLREAYGIGKDEAEEQIHEWEQTLDTTEEARSGAAARRDDERPARR